MRNSSSHLVRGRVILGGGRVSPYRPSNRVCLHTWKEAKVRIGKVNDKREAQSPLYLS